MTSRPCPELETPRPRPEDPGLQRGDTKIGMSPGATLVPGHLSEDRYSPSQPVQSGKDALPSQATKAISLGL